MALTFKHATGYHGIAAIGSQPGEVGKNNCKKVLCTGGSITLNQDPISSTGVWGANSPSAAQIAYAYNCVCIHLNVIQPYLGIKF